MLKIKDIEKIKSLEKLSEIKQGNLLGIRGNVEKVLEIRNGDLIKSMTTIRPEQGELNFPINYAIKTTYDFAKDEDLENCYPKKIEFEKVGTEYYNQLKKQFI